MNISINTESISNCHDNNHCTSTRFEKETKGNSEIISSTYSTTDILRINDFGKTFNFQCE